MHSPRISPLDSPARERFTVFAAGVVLSLVILAVVLASPAALTVLDGRIYDSLLSMRPAVQPSGRVVVVDVDDQSLVRHGQWPWPRYRVARLVEKITALGAASVAVDVLFSEPDRTSPVAVAWEMSRDLGLDVAFSGLPSGYADGDALLAKAVRDGPVSLGYAFTFAGEVEGGHECLLHPLKTFVRRGPGAPDGWTGLHRAKGVVCPLPQLATGAASSGFFNFLPDPDGVMRRAPLLIEHQGKIFPSLALAALIVAARPNQTIYAVEITGPASLSFSGVTIPLSGPGDLLVPYLGPAGAFTTISASDVLEGKADKAQVAGNIVILSASAAGLNDLHATPTDPAFPGGEVHASLVEAMLTGNFIQHPFWAIGAEILLALAAGLAMSALIAWSGAVASLLGLAAGLAACWGGSAWFLGRGVYISPLPPMLALVVAFSLLSAMEYWLEERRARKRAEQLVLTQKAALEAIANIAETRDPETGGHIRRTQNYVRILALHMRSRRGWEILDEDYVQLLYLSAPLHDIGKVGVPDRLLLKPGKLTPEEFEEMKLHAVYGRDIIERAEHNLGGNTFLSIAKEIAYCHHEKWDGTGYPLGLAGEDIPLSGRIMAVADVYDALISRRPYKEPFSHEATVTIITRGRGSHFDPALVDAFLALQDEFRAIAERFSDAEEPEDEPALRAATGG